MLERPLMLQGLYKVEMHTVHGSRRGVLYVYDGKMMGGNSAFAFIGTYQESAAAKCWSTYRHCGTMKIRITSRCSSPTGSPDAQGRQQGEQYFFEGGSTQLPGVAFNSV